MAEEEKERRVSEDQHEIDILPPPMPRIHVLPHWHTVGEYLLFYEWLVPGRSLWWVALSTN